VLGWLAAGDIERDVLVVKERGWETVEPLSPSRRERKAAASNSVASRAAFNFDIFFLAVSVLGLGGRCLTGLPASPGLPTLLDTVPLATPVLSRADDCTLPGGDWPTFEADPLPGGDSRRPFFFFSLALVLLELEARLTSGDWCPSFFSAFPDSRLVELLLIRGECEAVETLATCADVTSPPTVLLTGGECRDRPGILLETPDRERLPAEEGTGREPRRLSRKLGSSETEVALKPPERCASEGVGMELRPAISVGGGEREVAESSGKRSVDVPLLGLQYRDSSLCSIPLLSPESIPECWSPDSIPGVKSDALATAVGVRDVPLEELMLATVGTGVGRDLAAARDCDVERGVLLAEMEGGRVNLGPVVEEVTVGVASMVFDRPERSSLGIWYCMGNGVWTVTTGVRLSALDTSGGAATLTTTFPLVLIPLTFSDTENAV
jgi:hypothetical protein